MHFLFFALLLLTVNIQAQQQFDIVSYTPPPGFSTDQQADKVALSRIDAKKNTWCQFVIYQHTPSKGNIDKDFESEWALFAVKGLQVTAAPAVSTISTTKEWKQKSGKASFVFNNKPAQCGIHTWSNGTICFSVVANTNTTAFNQDIQQFISSVMPLTSANDTKVNTPPVAVSGKAAGAAFQYNTTPFDDGWTSVEKENWVEVSKPGIKVLIHHPRKETEDGEIGQHEGENKVWDILVAPRYSNLSNYKSRGLNGWEGITFLTGDATEKLTGRKVHIVLYKKYYAAGNGRFLEVVADNQTAFEKEFGNNYINSSSWDYTTQAASWNKLADMQWRNKFAVATNDLPGKWGVGNSSTLSYYYTSSGNYAGATAVSTADEFTFLPNNQYVSDHTGASGIVGSQKWSRQVYKGKSTVSDWSIALTNRFEGETEKFEAFFESVKGGRILVMKDRLGTVYTLVKK